nr:FadR/GntR family transcriptional regulator [uncultured Oscillibacter sp.]
MQVDKNRSSEQDFSFWDDLALGSRQHISEILFQRLREAIISGELPPGYVFPNENELCKKLNIGRSSLREAYSPLETLKLITRSKAGTFVNDLKSYRNTMNFDAIAKQTDTENLAEYRQIVEVGAVQLAAQKASKKDLPRLTAILQKMKDAADNPVALSQYDFEFHAYLMKMTRNELLIIMFNSIRSAYKNFTESVFALGCLPQTLREHQAIVDAVIANDPALATHMMQVHLSNIESFRSQNPPAV